MQHLLEQELAANIARFEDNMHRLDRETHSEQVAALQATVSDLETRLKQAEKKLVLVTSENHRLRQKLNQNGDVSNVSERDSLQTKYRTALKVIDQLQRGSV